MTASTIAIRPARASDVAAIESFVERYALVGHTVRFLDSADRPAPRAYASTSAHALTPPPIAPSGPRRPAARRLYGALDVGRLVERATVAVVAEEGGAAVAFLAVTARAPAPDASGADGHHGASARLAWAERTARELTAVDESPVECGSPLWLAACATAPGLDETRAVSALRRMLRECFRRAPFAPETLFFAGPSRAVERAPIGRLIEKRAVFTQPSTDATTKREPDAFALYSRARSDAAPALGERDARLEDYDDLAALAAFAASTPADRAPGGAAFGGFFFAGGSRDSPVERTADAVQREMARLIAEARASPETRRVLVAAEPEPRLGGAGDEPEPSRSIVALMAVTTEGVREDAGRWAETHDTAAYDDFAEPEEDAEGAGDAEFGADATARAESVEIDSSGEAETPRRLDALGNERGSRANEKAPNAFRVTAFASLPGYERETRPLFDAAFARFREVDFCAVRVPADAGEVPFATHEMVRVPFRFGAGAFAEHVLYARHREADAPGFDVRPGAPGDAPGVAELLAGAPGASAKVAAFAEACGVATRSLPPVAKRGTEPEKQTTSSSTADTNDRASKCLPFVATCDGQIVGYLLLDLSADRARFARARFRLDEIVEISAEDENAFAWLAAYEINPVFAHRRRRAGFALEALRQAGKTCALYAHAFEEEPAFEGEDGGSLRRLPEVVARDFLMARSRRLEGPPGSVSGPDAEFALFALTNRIAAATRRVVDAKVLIVGGDDAALAAAEALAAHETILFESVSLAAPAGGVYPGGFPASSAYASCVSGSGTTGHAGLAKLALGLDRVAYHEADLEALEETDRSEPGSEADGVGATRARVARFADSGESRFDVLALCLSSRDETRRAVLGDDADATPELRALPVERLDDFVARVSGMPAEARRALADGCECLVVYGATLDALGATRALARLGFEPGSVLRVVPEGEAEGGAGSRAAAFGTEAGPEKLGATERSLETARGGSLASFAEWAAASTPGLGAAALSLPGQPEALRGLALAGCEACALPSGAPGVRAYFEDQSTGAVTAVEATALLGCDDGDVDPSARAALDAAGLVTDGGVVVDGGFRTVDPCVFAAGDVAKFSKRVLLAGERSAKAPLSQTRAMRFRDRRECGVALAGAVAARFADDEAEIEETAPDAIVTAPPAFLDARVEAVTLASGAFFFRAGAPGAFLPDGLVGEDDDARVRAESERRIRKRGIAEFARRTRTTRTDGVFCRVESDARDVIVALSYAGPFVDARRFARCVGLPASLFFSEEPREDETKTKKFCLWRALSRPAASAAFHEDFRESFAAATRRARRDRDAEPNEESVAAAAQENVIAFVGKRAADLSAYHALAPGVTA